MLKYSELSENEKLRLHKEVLNLRKLFNISYRKIGRIIKKKFNILVPEATISNWIYFNRVPGQNKKTWFKPKSKPTRSLLYKLYVKDVKSPLEIGRKFGVTDNTVRKWIRDYDIYLRNKKEAMNTDRVKTFLRNLRLIKPSKPFRNLTPEKAYILGVLCGDGHINENFVQLEINKNDEEFMKEFIKCFKDVYGLKFSYHFRPKRNTLATYISPEFICDDLLSYGAFGVRKWRVPEVILKSNEIEIISPFLRGFFDSEGCVANRFIILGVVNKKGALDIVKLLRKVGINASFKEYLKTFKNYSTYVYTIGIYGKENIMRFKNMVNFTLSRKKRKLENLYSCN
jgi:intein-encoded DNA endonuclease-like protein